MKFTPCQDQCTYEGTHCEGCGRSHQEISDNKRLVMSVVGFIKTHNYENADLFMEVMSKSVLKKVPKTA
jgi:hypothetical protein